MSDILSKCAINLFKHCSNCIKIKISIFFLFPIEFEIFKYNNMAINNEGTEIQSQFCHLEVFSSPKQGRRILNLMKHK